MVWLPYDAGLSVAAETLVGILKRVIVSPAVYQRFLEIAELARSLCHSWATCLYNWHIKNFTIMLHVNIIKQAQQQLLNWLSMKKEFNMDHRKQCFRYFNLFRAWHCHHIIFKSTFCIAIKWYYITFESYVTIQSSCNFLVKIRKLLLLLKTILVVVLYRGYM